MKKKSILMIIVVLCLVLVIFTLGKERFYNNLKIGNYKKLEIEVNRVSFICDLDEAERVATNVRLKDPTSVNDATIYFPETVNSNGKTYEVVSIGDGTNSVIKGNTSIKTVVLPSGINRINDKAFSNQTNLNEIIFKGDSTNVSVGSNAFENCDSLYKGYIVIPNLQKYNGPNHQSKTDIDEQILEMGISNTNVLQEAVNDVSERGGGIVHIPSGIYYFAVRVDDQNHCIISYNNNGTIKDFVHFAINCKDNVLVEGEGQWDDSNNTGTLLKPYGDYGYGLNMFDFRPGEINETPESPENYRYIVNADFREFTIDSIEEEYDRRPEIQGKNTDGSQRTYNAMGKGFMMAPLKDCDWKNVTVKNTDGTGFGVDLPINCTIKNCTAIGCGKAATESNPGASGFGIGTGLDDEESMVIENCISLGNKKYGYFFENQTRFSQFRKYKPNKSVIDEYSYVIENPEEGTPLNYAGGKTSSGYILINCLASENLYDYGGARSNDVIYENCKSEGTPRSKGAIYFEVHSFRNHVLNTDIELKFDDINDDSYYKDAIYWAYENGITTGITTEEGFTFKPENECMKEYAILFLHRYANYEGRIVAATNQEVIGKLNKKRHFKDIEEPKGAFDAVEWAAEKGIIDSQGMGDNAGNLYTNIEDKTCKRKEFITMLWRYAGRPEVDYINNFVDVQDSTRYFYKPINWATSIGILDDSGSEPTFGIDIPITRGEIVQYLYDYNKSIGSTFNVVYYLNDGHLENNVSNISSYESSNTESYTINNPVKSGYTFLGWTGSNGIIPDSDLIIEPNTTGNLVYTANWKENEYNIVLHENDGENKTITQRIKYTDSEMLFGFNLTGFNRQGYQFIGWNTKPDGVDGINYEDKAIIVGKSAFENMEDGSTINLYAIWNPDNYTIVFDSNGGVAVNPATITKPYEKALGTLPTTSREGYIFLGWFTERNGGTQISPSTTMPLGGATYYAHWAEGENHYTVIHKKETFEDSEYVEFERKVVIDGVSTGMSVTPPVKSMEGFTAPPTQTVTVAADGSTTVTYLYDRNEHTVTVTAGTGIASTTKSGTYKYDANVTVGYTLKPGYEFKEWTGDKTDATFKMPDSNVNMTAVGQIITYSITYNINDGTVQTANPTTYNVETETFTLNNPTKKGYTFSGWTGSNGTNPQVTVSIPKGSIGDKGYTANYTISSYTAMFDSNGGIAANPPTIVKPYKEALGTLPTTSRNGYDFLGWFTEINGGTKISSTTIMPEGGATYYAHWAEKAATLKYDANGHGTAPENVTMKYTTATNVASAIKAIGYTFTGWNTKANGTGTSYAAGTQIKAANEIPVAMTVYAQWKLEYYNIEYDLKGGIVSGNPNSYSIEIETITLNNPSKNGYIFIGWTGSNGSIPELDVRIEKGSTGNKEYIANWKEEYYFHIKKYLEDDEYIVKINPNTKRIDFENNIETNLNYTIKEGNNEVKEEDLIKTGQILSVSDKKYILIVSGDLNKDGKVSVSDLALIQRKILHPDYYLDEASIKAGDKGSDGSLSVIDLARIQKFILIGEGL